MVTLLRTPLALLLLAPLVGCNSPSPDHWMSLAQGERAFRSKQYRGAVEHLSLFLREVEEGPEVARALYVRGMARALAGQRAQAYADLQHAARESLDPETAWQPHAVLGVLYFEDERWDAAARAFANAANRMPPVPPKDALLFRIGLCHERTGCWAAALTAYRRIVTAFPRGVYAEAAERRLQLKAAQFAVQCGVFSRIDNAERLVAQLQQQGLRPYVRPEQRKGTPCHVVLEGRYDSYQQGIHALARVRGYVPQAVLWP